MDQKGIISRGERRGERRHCERSEAIQKMLSRQCAMPKPSISREGLGWGWGYQASEVKNQALEIHLSSG
jgi:hypothetical protein